MKIKSLALLLICGHLLHAQQQAFDVFTFTPPKGWKQSVEQDALGFSITNNKNGSWAQISVLKSTVSTGSSEADFEREWKDLVINSYGKYGISEKPTISDTQSLNGWKHWIGRGRFIFNKDTAELLLHTFSDGQRCASFTIVNNKNVYNAVLKQFISSVKLERTTVNSVQTANDIASSPPVKEIIGTWVKKSSVQPNYGNVVSWGSGGYTTDQYHFNGDGTYQFYSKAFAYSMTNLLLIKESGRYTTSGNTITVIPSSCVLESWSKYNGTDKWGSLVKTTKRALEKVTYTFTMHYFSGLDQWNLVLQPGTPTMRDGTISSNISFHNAYLYGPPTSNNVPIQLPGQPSGR